MHQERVENIFPTIQLPSNLALKNGEKFNAEVAIRGSGDRDDGN
jgi:hypothetical protein